MAITPLPTPPQKSQPEVEFVEKADAFLGALPNFGAEANALAVSVEQDKQDAEQAVTDALGHAQNADASYQQTQALGQGILDDAQEIVDEGIDEMNGISGAVFASLNYKGPWGDLSGPLDIPASTYHGETFWQLVDDVQNVAQEEPGVSNKWASTSGLATLKTSNFLAQPGGDYILAPGVTMTLPASPTIGQRVTFRAAGDIESIMADMPMVARNGNEIQGIDEDVQINGQGSVTLIWAGVVQGGWI